jgi:SAM-dependent methyltransferase
MHARVGEQQSVIPPGCSQPQIDAAEAYARLFVPALFQEWVPRLLEAARIRPGHRVLDVACGTGVLARGAASATGPSGSVAGLDREPGMLAVAARTDSGVAWRQGTAESLPYADASFHAVVSQFALMFFVDRNRALREMLRVLEPGGHLAVAVWDSLDKSPAYAAEVALLERVAGKRAADALRGPFVLGDREILAQLFTGAGVASAAVKTYPGTANFPSVRSMVEADLRGWLPVMGVSLTDNQINHILEEAEVTLRPYTTPEGRAVFATSAHIVAGIKPRARVALSRCP